MNLAQEPMKVVVVAAFAAAATPLHLSLSKLGLLNCNDIISLQNKAQIFLQNIIRICSLFVLQSIFTLKKNDVFYKRKFFLLFRSLTNSLSLKTYLVRAQKPKIRKNA